MRRASAKRNASLIAEAAHPTSLFDEIAEGGRIMARVASAMRGSVPAAEETSRGEMGAGSCRTEAVLVFSPVAVSRAAAATPNGAIMAALRLPT